VAVAVVAAAIHIIKVGMSALLTLIRTALNVNTPRLMMTTHFRLVQEALLVVLVALVRMAATATMAAVPTAVLSTAAIPAGHSRPGAQPCAA
jgi:hypothetical protein